MAVDLHSTVVPNAIPPGAVRIALVGEAPGEEEARHRPPTPFVGPAGRVLDMGLRRAGIDRAECALLNVFQTKAPDNDVSPWLVDRVRMADARERLAQDLAAANPNVIVPMGGTALWALTGERQIMAFRGAVMKASSVRMGAKLVPTIHPAAVMRTWKLMVLFVKDLVKAAHQSAYPEVRVPARRLHLCPDLEDVREFMEAVRVVGRTAVDIETGWGMITCIGFAASAEEAMCIPFVDTRRVGASYWEDAEDEVQAWKAVRTLCADREVVKIGQNFLYDAAWLHEYGIPVYNYREDTRLMHHALYPELPKSLGSMAASYTDLPAWKHWNKQDEKDDK